MTPPARSHLPGWRAGLSADEAVMLAADWRALADLTQPGSRLATRWARYADQAEQRARYLVACAADLDLLDTNRSGIVSIGVFAAPLFVSHWTDDR